MIFFHYLKLLFYFYFLFRLKFFLSQFKIKYLPDGTLVDDLTTKKFYKNLKSIAVFNYWYQSLHRKILSNRDLTNTYYYALLWTLQDEHTDQVDKQLMLKFELLKKIRAELKSQVPNTFVFEALGTKLVEVQIQSQIQKNSKINIDQLIQIEEEKAGYSFPFYACLIDFPPISNQFQLLYDFGVILQHIDDALDIYEDLQENTKTVANAIGIEEFETFFNSKTDAFIQFLVGSKASKQAIVVAIVCFGIGWVQIERLKKLKSSSQNANFDSQPREALICDMAKLKNLIIHYQFVKSAFYKIKFS